MNLSNPFSNPKLLRFKSLFISLFALFGLVAIILSINYYATIKVERNSNIIDGAGEMSDQFYNLALDIQQLKDTPPNGRQDLADSAKETQAEIDTLLTLLDTGGVYDYGDGDYLDIDALQSPASREALEAVQDKWDVYTAQLDSVLSSPALYTNDQNQQQQLLQLSQYALDEQENIYDSIDEIYADRFDDSQFWNDVGKFVLIGGISLISLYFLWFVLYFMRRLIRSEEYLQESRQQNQEILSTINEGLFLIDKDLIIAEQYSDKLEDIVNKKNVAGKSLLDVIAPLVSDKDLTVAKSFIKQLYSNWVVEDLIEELNPLKNIKVAVTLEDGRVVTRYLDFEFSRVLEDDEIIRILVTVTDITKATELGEKLAQEQQQNDRQIEMISNLIDIDGASLQEFIASVNEHTRQINEVLKVSGSEQSQMHSKAQGIYRHVHSIKGEASALKLQPFIDVSQRFEDNISTILERSELSGNDFIPLAVLLEEMMVLLDFVDSLAHRLHLYTASGLELSGGMTHNGDDDPATDLQSKRLPQAYFDADDGEQIDLDDMPPSEITSRAQPEVTPSPRASKWQNFAQDIAKRHRKQITLEMTGFDSDALATINTRNTHIINDVVMQLLRNAIVHGIEVPKVRQQLGKPATGRIQLQLLHLKEAEIELVIEDDGRGIDFYKIKQKAIDAGLVSEGAELSKNQLIELMFTQGISTANELSEDAGRGVGMDIIKSSVAECGGSLAVNTQFKQYTRFTIRLPNGDPQ